MGFKLNTNLINVEPLIEDIKDTGEITEAAQEAVASVGSPVHIGATISFGWLGDFETTCKSYLFWDTGVAYQNNADNNTQLKPGKGFRIKVAQGSTVIVTFYTGYGQYATVNGVTPTSDIYTFVSDKDQDVYVKNNTASGSVYIISIYFSKSNYPLNDVLFHGVGDPQLGTIETAGIFNTGLFGSTYVENQSGYNNEYYGLYGTYEGHHAEVRSEVGNDDSTAFNTLTFDDGDIYHKVQINDNLKMELNQTIGDNSFGLTCNNGTDNANHIVTMDKDEFVVHFHTDSGTTYDHEITIDQQGITLSTSADEDGDEDNCALKITADGGLQVSPDGGTTNYSLTKLYLYTWDFKFINNGNTITLSRTFVGPGWLTGNSTTKTLNDTQTKNLLIGTPLTILGNSGSSRLIGMAGPSNVHIVVTSADGTVLYTLESAMQSSLTSTITRGQSAMFDI